MIAPLATLFELTPISYMPPAWSLNLSPFWRPHSTNVSPTALSVISFQLAENHTLKTPDAGAAICAAGVAAAAGAEVGAGAAPAGGLGGWAPPLGAGCVDVGAG